jgi:RimJ/RimL family protein N-acetyltransferase
MPFFSTPHLDLTTSRIETSRCVLVPFSLDGRVDIRELAEEFRNANKDLYVSQFLPNHEEEMDFVTKVVEQIKSGELFENFILEKGTNRLIGCAGLNHPEDHTMNIGIWIRTDEHGK